MRSPDRACRMRLAGILALVAAVAVAMLSQLAATASAAAPAAWQSMARPWNGDVAVKDIAAAGQSFVAVAGAEGRVAVSTTGGRSWTVHSPAAAGLTANLLGIAFGTETQGVVVGAGGALLVTDDGGFTWTVPSFSGEAPTVDLNDVDMAGTRAVAVGDEGVVIESTTGGDSWQALPQPGSQNLTCVAVAEDGTVVAGAQDGSVFVRKGMAWTTQVHVAGPVKSVTIRSAPAQGTNQMTIVASSGFEVVGSEDGLSFSTLLSATYASSPPWPELTWSHMPIDEFLVAGLGGEASYYAVTPTTWTTGSSGVGDARAVAAAPQQSIAYVLGEGGGVARTLSSGRTAATLTATPKTVTAGRKTTLASTVRIAATGDLVVERSAAGGAWRSAKTLPWTTGDWARQLALGYYPTSTTKYRLRFRYGGVGQLVSTTVTVSVKPRLTPDELRLTVSRGTAYRFKGRVYPALRGESVRLYTDRGGKWHRIDLGGVVKLSHGTRWVSRLFGTPKRETYHLRAKSASNSRHAASWSRVVTVVVR